MPSLRIGIDGRRSARRQGGRRYVRELTRALLELDPQLQIIAVGASPGTALPNGVRAPSRAHAATNQPGMAKTLGVSNAIRLVPHADDHEVVALMRSATVFAYSSLYEGFGLHVLEAMAAAHR